MNLESILYFIKSFVGWQESKKPFHFEVLSQRQYEDGLLLRVSRKSVTSRANSAEVATYIFINKNKTKPYLYLFLDSLEGRGIRNLSHRIQIFSSDRHLNNESVKVNIHLSESYYLGDSKQANSIVVRLILYCYGQNYESVDWDWEIEQCRKQIMLYQYTDHTQEKAREDSRFLLDRFELRFTAPSNINPLVIEKVAEIINPPKAKPKSRVIELMLIGGILIGLLWVLINK